MAMNEFKWESFNIPQVHKCPIYNSSLKLTERLEVGKQYDLLTDRYPAKYDVLELFRADNEKDCPTGIHLFVSSSKYQEIGPFKMSHLKVQLLHPVDIIINSKGILVPGSSLMYKYNVHPEWSEIGVTKYYGCK